MPKNKTLIPHNTEREVLVTGHRNPDTDSICAAIAYANALNERAIIFFARVPAMTLPSNTRDTF